MNPIFLDFDNCRITACGKESKILCNHILTPLYIITNYMINRTIYTLDRREGKTMATSRIWPTIRRGNVEDTIDPHKPLEWIAWNGRLTGQAPASWLRNHSAKTFGSE